MKELIKIGISPNGNKVVSARELYDFLGVKSNFATWCKRMFEYGFEDAKDYSLINSKNGINSNSGRPEIDYALTLDTAKEIAMLQRSDKGKQARQYFIECEKRLIEKHKILPGNFKEALIALLESETEKERLLEQAQMQDKVIAKQAPKVIYHDQVLQSESLIPVGIIAKELGMSATALNKKLYELKVQYILNDSWVLYSKYQNQGLTGTKTTSYRDSNGYDRTCIHTYWSEKGRQFIHEMMNSKLNR